jgi:hypothetical protein
LRTCTAMVVPWYRWVVLAGVGYGPLWRKVVPYGMIGFANVRLDRVR